MLLGIIFILKTPQKWEKNDIKLFGQLAVVVVKWSACSPSTPMIRVRILLTLTVFSVKCVFEKNENKEKEAGGGPL